MLPRSWQHLTRRVKKDSFRGLLYLGLAEQDPSVGSSTDATITWIEGIAGRYTQALLARQDGETIGRVIRYKDGLCEAFGPEDAPLSPRREPERIAQMRVEDLAMAALLHPSRVKRR